MRQYNVLDLLIGGAVNHPFQRFLVAVGLAIALVPAALSQTSYTWSGSAGTAWNNAANWSPSTGFPGATDHATIVTAMNMPVLDVARSVINLTLTTGTLDLNGYTLTCTGTGTFNGGAVSNGVLTANSPSGSMIFGGTLFGATVNGTSSTIRFAGSTFNAPVNLTKTGVTTDNGTGNTTFNSTLTLAVTNGQLTLANSGSVVFNGSVTLSSTASSTGISLGQSAGAVSLAAGSVINIGTFNAGILRFQNFVQLGATPQNIALTGTATVTFHSGTVFNGAVIASAPGVYMSGSTFNANGRFTKTGATNEYSAGGCTYNGTAEFISTGVGTFYLANSSNDQYNGDVLVNSTGSGGIVFGPAGSLSTIAPGRTFGVGSTGYTAGRLTLRGVLIPGNTTLNLGNTVAFSQYAGTVVGGSLSVTAGSIQLHGGTVQGNARYTKTSAVTDLGAGDCTYNADLVLENNSIGIWGFCETATDQYNGDLRISNSSTGAIRFGNVGGAAVLATGKVIVVGAGGFSGGSLSLKNFTQQGSAPQALVLGTGALLEFLAGTTFNGPVTSTSGRLIFTGATFNGTATFEKTGPTGDASSGGNTFNHRTEFINRGAGNLSLNQSAGVDQFNGDLYLNSTSTGVINFGAVTGSAVLAAGKVIAVGTAGFASGTLVLRSFTQVGATPQALNLGTAAQLEFQTGTTFNGPITSTSGRLIFNGATFHGTATFEKTGPTGDASSGGNTFNQRTEFINRGAGNLSLNQSAGVDQFNGDLYLNSTSTGAINFGAVTGSAVLAAGKVIAVGTAGFASGALVLRSFTQVGATPQALNLGTAAQLEFQTGTTFNGPIMSTSGRLIFNGATFHGTATFEKTGPTGDASSGGNTFNQRTEFINRGAGNISLNQNAGVDQFNGDLYLNSTSTGVINFGAVTGSAVLAAGKVIAVGTAGFASGALVLRSFTQVGATPQALNLGTAAQLEFQTGTTFNGPITSTSGRLIFNGATFHGTATFEKTGPTGDASSGGNTFNQRTEFINRGAGNLSLNQSAGVDQFNGDLYVNNISTGVINFGAVTGSAVLAAGKVIAVGTAGFASGALYLRNFTQVGATPQALNLGTGAHLEFQTGTTFNGAFTSTSGRLLFFGATFNGTATFEKTGPSGDGSSGGNTFNQRTEFINRGAGILSLNQNAGVDQFNGDLYLNNTSTGVINFGAGTGSAVLAAGKVIAVGSEGYMRGTLGLRNFTQLGATTQTLDLGITARLELYPGTTFNGVIATTSGSLFLHGATFNRASRFVKTGPSGDGSNGNNVFNDHSEFWNTGAGILSLHQTAPDLFNGNVRLSNTSTGTISFGQGVGSSTLAAGRTIAVGSGGFNAGSLAIRNFTQVGGTAQSLLLGTLATLRLETGNTVNGALVTTSGNLYLNGTTFNSTAKFTKTGAGGDGSIGGNVYNGVTEFILTGTGHLSLAQTLSDQFNDHVWMNCTNNIGIISTGQGTGSATLAAGRTIGIGTTGFTAGTLQLRNFTQLGSTAQVLNLGNSATLSFQAYNTFGGNVRASAGNLLVAQSVFNGTCWFRKTNTASSVSSGGNTFNGDVELVNEGTGIFYMCNVLPDVYYGDLLLNSTATGGINFGNSTGTSTMSTGVLGIGGTGFTAGTIVFRNFTKSGAAACVLAGTTATAVTFSTGSSFNGDMSVTSGHLLFNGTTFHGNGVFNKTNSGNNSSNGGNVFNGDVEINAGGQMSLANSAADDFNGNVIFRRLAAGAFIVNNSFNTTFSKDVSTVGSTGSVQFGGGASRTIFDGTVVQTFNSDAAFPPVVRNLTLAMTGAGELQLLGNVNVTVDMAFTSGIIKPMAATSTDNGLLILGNGITFSNVADGSSYADGFVRKVGNTAFSFPVGNAGVLAPISISAPATNTHHFTAKYVHDDSHATYTHTLRDMSIHHISRCEYWILDRTNSSTNVTVTLSYDSVRSCGVSRLADLVVVRWNDSMWKDHGNGMTTGTLAQGSITTAGPVTAFSPFTLASRSAMNPLPITLIAFEAVNEGAIVRTSWTTASEQNNDHFEVERSADGIHFAPIGRVEGALTSQSVLHYAFDDQEPLDGLGYYRLKQVDVDGTFTTSEVVVVSRTNERTALLLWPNPVEEELFFNVGGDRIPIHARVHDAAGRLVVDQALNGTSALDLRNVLPGALVLSVEMADGTQEHQRLLKR